MPIVRKNIFLEVLPLLRKVLFLFVTVLLVVPVAVPTYAEEEPIEHEIDADDIQAKFEEIADSYELNEPLSDEDAAFVKKYSDTFVRDEDELIQPLKSSSFDKTKYNSGKSIGLWLKGNVKSSHAVLSNSFGGRNATYVVKNSKKATKITAKIRHTAFGIIGSGGVGKVYDGSISATCKKKGVYSCTAEGTKKYTASVAYSNTWATSTVTYGSGSTFSVTAK